MQKTKWDKFIAKTFTKTLKLFLKASEREMEPYVKEKIKEFLKNKHTPEEIFDFCDSISKLPMTKLSDKVCMGDISSFMQSVFDVTKYYEIENKIKNKT